MFRSSCVDKTMEVIMADVGLCIQIDAVFNRVDLIWASNCCRTD